MAQSMNRPKPVVLVILDGFGIAPPYPGNAVANANMLVFNRLIKAFPHCLLHSAGTAVGLPHGVMGNSEVGHMNIGAGTIIYQTLPRINAAITNGSFYENRSIIEAIEHCKKNGSNFHLMGCTSTGNVHSTTEHLFACLQCLEKQGFDGNKVFIHCFTDGRDTDTNLGKTFLDQVMLECKRTGIGRIASVIGRYFAMDRNNKWDRIKKAYDLIVNGVGEKFRDPVQALEQWYAKGVTDEFIEPSVILNDEGNINTVKDGDAIFFFNYRSDRAIQLSRCFVGEDFKEFETHKFADLYFLGMTQYDRKLTPFMHLVFDPENVHLPLGRVISEAGLRQLRMAETEKFAHVSFFLNGGRDLIFPNEDRVLVPSPKVATYDLKPEMSTYELTQVLINKIRLKSYDFIVINIACPDMVGHTGNYNAVIKALKAVDRNLDRIILNTLAVGGVVCITSDHGNSEVMIDYRTGRPHTEHTTNPVPFIYVGPGAKPVELPMGALSDVAPTILHLLGLPVPSTMSLSTNLLAPVLKN
jgi:2,3-bisphosphoglycerate-independent phosphoglycerate mutase